MPTDHRTAGREAEAGVRAALGRDPRIPHPEQIAISADEIGTVTLRGTVGSPQQRHAAGVDASAVDGVFEVWNQLQVSFSESRHRDDNALRGEALQALMSDPEIPAQRIEVAVRDGWVTLTGEVKHGCQRALASELVSELPGVTGITDDIRVFTEPLDWMITDDDDENDARRR